MLENLGEEIVENFDAQQNSFEEEDQQHFENISNHNNSAEFDQNPNSIYESDEEEDKEESKTKAKFGGKTRSKYNPLAAQSANKDGSPVEINKGKDFNLSEEDIQHQSPYDA